MLTSACCPSKVISCDSETVIQEVAILMRLHHVNHVAITGKAGQTVPLGIVTEHAIVTEVLGADLDARTMTAGDIMYASVIRVQAYSELSETLNLMRMYQVRYVSVLSADGDWLGIVTMNDIIELLIDDL